jgi:membrane protease YdiL (CAAX protease family)
MSMLGRLFYDSGARRVGPVLRGHLLMFDRRDAPAYSAKSGLWLLAIFVLVEYVLGPRLDTLRLLNVPLPRTAICLLLQTAAVVCAVRLVAKLRWRDIGFLPLTQWTATEVLYFLQVVLAAAAIFYFLYVAGLPLAAAPVQAIGLIAATQLLWGLYQELIYRGILQTELARRFGTIWGLLIANLAFTFGPLHSYYFHSTLSDIGKAAMFGAIFAIGLFFAFIFARTRNLWIVGVFHGIGNLFTNGGGEIHSLLSRHLS